MFTKYITDIFQYIENIVDGGDKYYVKLIRGTHIINIVYILLYYIFGISLLNYQGLSDINTGIRMFVCILLLVKFHPFREHKPTASDSTLIFSSALFLFLNLSIIEVLNRFTKTISNVTNTIDKL
jgi:hypothetical protein